MDEKVKELKCPKCGAVIPGDLVRHAAACAWGKRGGQAGKGSPAKRAAAVQAARIRWARYKAAGRALALLLALAPAAGWAQIKSIQAPILYAIPTEPPRELYQRPQYALIYLEECDNKSLGIGLKIAFRETAIKNGFKLLQDLEQAFGFGFQQPYLLIGIAVMSQQSACLIQIDFTVYYGKHERNIHHIHLLCADFKDPEEAIKNAQNLLNDSLFDLKFDPKK